MPLRSSTRLLTRAPSISNLLNRTWSLLEVPGFYVVRDAFFEPWEDLEDYRVPVAWEIDAAGR